MILAPMLKHKNNQIRAEAVDALARFDVPTWAEEFRNLLPRSDVGCALRGGDRSLAGAAADAATVDALMAALKDQYEDVALRGGASLGRIKGYAGDWPAGAGVEGRGGKCAPVCPRRAGAN